MGMTALIEKSVYLTQEQIDAINDELEDAGNSFSDRVRYCINNQLQREAIDA